MIRKFLLMTLLVLVPAMAKAACVPSPLGLRLGIPGFGDSGPAWANCIINDLLILNANGGGGAGGSGGSSLVLDNLQPFIDGSTNTFQLSTAPFNANSIFLVRDGLLLSNTSDYTWVPPATIRMSSAPQINTTSFYALYFKVPTSTGSAPSNGGSIDPTLISSGAFTTSGFIQIYLPYTDANYVLNIQGVQNTSPAKYNILLNNDSTAVYDWSGYIHNAQNSPANVTTYADSRSIAVPYCSANTNVANQLFTLRVSGIIPSASPTYFIGTFESTTKFGSSANESEHAQGMIYYNNTNVSTIKISASAGSMTGKYWLTATR